MRTPASTFSRTIMRYSKTASIAHAAASMTASQAERLAVVISGSAGSIEGCDDTIETGAATAGVGSSNGTAEAGAAATAGAVTAGAVTAVPSGTAAEAATEAS